MIGINKQSIVLSFGRSASVMIAHRISSLLGHNLGFVKHYNDLPACTVQHTHLLFSSDELNNFCRIFSLRKDPIQTILSFLFVARFKVYHKVGDKNQNVLYQHDGKQTTDLTLSPFVFDDWNSIEMLCNRYSKWHQFYSQHLLPSDYVVFYENILNRVENRNTNYQLVYDNKEKILLNYDEIVKYIRLNFKDDMLDSQLAYENHQNSTNIYKFLSKDI